MRDFFLVVAGGIILVQAVYISAVGVVDPTPGMKTTLEDTQLYTNYYHTGFTTCIESRYDNERTDVEYQIIVDSCNVYANDYASAKFFESKRLIKNDS